MAAARDLSGRGCRGLPDLDRGRHRHSRKQAARQWIGPIDRDLDRYALHYLGEVAGGVVGRQQSEFLTAGRRYAVDSPAHRLAVESVHVDLDWLARFDIGKLGLLVVGDDISLSE